MVWSPAKISEPVITQIPGGINMAVLKRLWVAMLTRDTEDSGTEDRIVLIVNEDGVEKLHHTFPNTPQDDQDRGQPNLYEIDVKGRNIRSENLTNSSIRMGIRGSDFWHPEHVLVWGEDSSSGAVIPLALEVDIDKGISTDSNEGNLSFPLRRIGLSRPSEEVIQLIACLITADVEDAGTDDAVDFKLTFAGGKRERSLEFSNLGRGQASFSENNLSFAGEPQPTKTNLESVVLRINGAVDNPGSLGQDAWLPSSFFLFASSQTFGGLMRSIIPLVYIPRWELGALSVDPSEGQTSIELPLFPTPNLPPNFNLDINVRFSQS
jgi:hypothetical protein